MTRKTFCCPMYLRDKFLFDIECEIECSVDDDTGTSEPYLVVHDIFMDGERFPQPTLHSPGMWELISAEIRKRAAEYDDLFEEVAAEEGWVFSGGYWRLPTNYYDAA